MNGRRLFRAKRLEWSRKVPIEILEADPGQFKLVTPTGSRRLKQDLMTGAAVGSGLGWAFGVILLLWSIGILPLAGIGVERGMVVLFIWWAMGAAFTLTMAFLAESWGRRYLARDPKRVTANLTVRSVSLGWHHKLDVVIEHESDGGIDKEESRLFVMGRQQRLVEALKVGGLVKRVWE